MIVRFAGSEVGNGRHLRNLVAGTAPGTKVTLELIRDGKPITVTATVDKQAAEPGALARPPEPASSRLEKLGIEVEALTPELARQLQVDVPRGVVITDVAGEAAMAGLRKGDVIVEANRIPVGSPSELLQALSKATDPHAVLLLIKRQDASMFVVIRG